MQCKICNGKAVVSKIVDGKSVFVPCTCVAKSKFYYAYKDFLPAGKPPEGNTKSRLDNIIKHNLSNRLFYLAPNKDYKSIILYYLYSKYKFNPSFRVVKSYSLIDIMMNKREDDNIYDFIEKTLVFLYGFSKMPNKQEIPVLLQLIDFYHLKKEIIIYSAVDSPEIMTYLSDKSALNILTPKKVTTSIKSNTDFDFL